MNSISEHFTPSMTDRITISVHSALASDQVLVDWTHGSIHRCSILMPIDMEAPPQIIVAPKFEQEMIGPNQTSELNVPVSILIVWEENQRVLSETEPSVGSVVNHIKALLLDRYYLNIPPFNERLVRRLESFDTVDYGVVETEDNELVMYVEMAVIYRTDINARTRSKRC